MSVLINMEMPKLYKTYKVRFVDDGEGKILVGVADLDSTTYKPIGEAIKVPDGHGRLIDEDALFEEYENVPWYDNKDRDDVAEEILLNAPTVIPSDKEET